MRVGSSENGKGGPPAKHSSKLLQRALSIMQRPFPGPLLFGLVFGGIPFGIVLFHWGLTDKGGDLFFEQLTPIAVFVAALGAILTTDSSPARLFWRAFFTSFGACVPVPTLTWAVLLWRVGTEILDLRNLPFATILFVLWMVGVTVLGWLLALSFAFLKNRGGPPALAGESTTQNPLCKEGSVLPK